VAGMGEQIMHPGFEGNVFRKKIPQRISSHRLEDNIKIVLKKTGLLVVDWVCLSVSV
jgi:hypothetical protein